MPGVLACRTKAALSLLRVVIRVRGVDGVMRLYTPYSTPCKLAMSVEASGHQQTRNLRLDPSSEHSTRDKMTEINQQNWTAVDPHGRSKTRIAFPAITIYGLMMAPFTRSNLQHLAEIDGTTASTAPFPLPHPT
jgi:hypothetical protein